jgi:chromosome segregation ATPase
LIQKIIIAALAVVFILLAINIVTSLYFFKQYKENLNYFDQQNWLTRVKLENMEKTMEGYKGTIENLNTQFTNYAENISSLDKKIGAGEEDRKDMLTKIEAIKSDIQGWQKSYNNILNEIKERTDILKTNVEQLAKGITEQVNLGKISVKSGEEATQAQPAKASYQSTPAPNVEIPTKPAQTAGSTQSAKSTSSGTNFGPR